MSKARPFAVALGGALFLLTSVASAATTEREVMGWTPAGDVVVQLVERGERMVEGISKDYYFEATEVWSSDSGKLTGLFKHGEAVGAVPETYTEARSDAEGDLHRQQAQPSSGSAQNAAQTHSLAWFFQTRIDRPDERNFVCKRRYRVVLLSKPDRRAYTVLDAESSGEPSRRQDEAFCAPLNVRPHWSPDGQRFVAFIDDGRTTEITSGKLDGLERYPYGEFTPTPPAASALASGAVAEAWRALDGGAWDQASAKFTEAGLAGGAALTAAMRGDKQALKLADSVFKKSKQEPHDVILRAATYVAAGQGKKATKWIDAAVAKAASYQELLAFAAAFQLLDPGIANQLAVHALSHESAKSADTALGWTLLARGLIAVGDYGKAEEALGKLSSPTPASLALQAALHIDKREIKLATSYAEDLTFNNPGDCVGYLIQGRLRSLAGDNVDARVLFGAAVACDPTMEDASFFAADFARLSGDVSEARQRFDHYLAVAPARRSDPIREARRGLAERWSKRFGHKGVVLIDVSCRRGGEGYLCTGTLKNTSDSEAQQVAVSVAVKRKSAGAATVEQIAPGATAPFGISFAAKSLSDAVVTAGRDKDERALNETPAR